MRDQLERCSLGYRLKYVISAADAMRLASIEELELLPDSALEQKLMEIHGVGKKWHPELCCSDFIERMHSRLMFGSIVPWSTIIRKASGMKDMLHGQDWFSNFFLWKREDQRRNRNTPKTLPKIVK